MNYRAEIDGLRALAVVPVILFHAGFNSFSGGFVGVDVFFVISGYLITSILIEDIENKRFSIVRFYERRARRILPALYFVMLVCIPFAWLWMTPNQIKEFSQSLLAVSLFSSNILFWRQSGYFESSAEEKPLLHTWSLSVEEQYYIIFPFFLFFTWRFGKNKVFWMIVLMATVSLLLSEWGWRNKPVANFYLAPTRAWELCSGSIAAFVVQRKGVRGNNALALLGLIAIVFAIFAFDASTPFPSVYTLVPVVGVVLLVLFASEETFAARLLRAKPLVGIGLISYSAYLWHQPLFAFARIRQIEEVSHLFLFFLSLISVFLAVLTYKYIEQPFRRAGGPQKFSRSQVFVFSFVSITVFCVVGTAGHVSNGYIDRTAFAEIRGFQETQNQRGSGFRFCESNSIQIRELKGTICKIGDKNAEPTGVLWGDSYAGASLYGVSRSLEKDGLSYLAVLSDGCPPMPGISRTDREARCTYDRQQDVLNWFANQNSLMELVWVGRFRSLVGSGKEEGYFIDKKSPDLRVVETKVRKSMNFLVRHKKRIVFVLEGPSFKQDIPTYLSKVARLGLTADRSITTAKTEEQRQQIALTPEFFDGLQGVDYVDSLQIFCNDDVCNSIFDDGQLLVVDSGHISHAASLILAKEIFAKLGR